MQNNAQDAALTGSSPAESTVPVQQNEEGAEGLSSDREQSNEVDEQGDQEDARDEVAAEEDQGHAHENEDEEDNDQEDARDEVAEFSDRLNAAFDEQTRWIQNLSQTNPDEFNRLVQSGVIDQDFLDRVAQLDADDTATDGAANDNGEAAHADNTTTAEQDITADIVKDTTAPPNTDHFVWLPDRNDAQDENTTCPACLTDFDPTELTVFLTCGHQWCSVCLNANYSAALKNRKDFSPTCCGHPIDHDSIHPFLDEDLLV